MKKLMLEALAAWLALAAAYGQVFAAIQTGPNVASTMISSRGNEAFAKGGIAANGEVALLPSALKRQAVFNQREAGALQHVVLPVNRDSGQIKEIRIVRIDDPETVKFDSVTDTRPISRTAFPVPEPGSWATALAGLLGVIAIARRRMSL